MLAVRELHCSRCELSLRGDFALSPPETVPSGLPPLTEDQAAFLRLFVRSRGNLTEIERTLGVSYPTVRAKVDDLIRAIEAPPASPEPPPAPRTRHEVLTQIAAGQLSAAQGLALIRRLTRTPSQEGDTQ